MEEDLEAKSWGERGMEKGRRKSVRGESGLSAARNFQNAKTGSSERQIRLSASMSIDECSTSEEQN